MKHTFTIVGTLFILAVALSGCDPSTTAPVGETPPELETAAALNTGAVAIPEHEQGSLPTVEETKRMTPNELGALFLPNRESTTALRLAIVRAGSWSEADDAVRALLEEPSEAPTYVREQQAAALMLGQWLLKEGEKPSKQPAIAFYTDLLIRNESWQIGLIDGSLAALDGYWSDGQIAEAAQQTLDRAVPRLARASGCENCNAGQIADRIDGTARRSDQSQSAVALRSLEQKAVASAVPSL